MKTTNKHNQIGKIVTTSRVLVFSVFLLTINFGLLNAQTNQGNVLIGVTSNISSLLGTGSSLMNLGYSSTKYKSDADGYQEPDPDKTITINLLPKVGYFVVDNLAFGLDVNISLSTKKYGESGSKSSQTFFLVGPFIRCYIPTSKVLPFFELNGSFGTAKTKYKADDYDSEHKSSLMSLAGGFGLAAPLGDRVMVDVLLDIII